MNASIRRCTHTTTSSFVPSPSPARGSRRPARRHRGRLGLRGEAVRIPLRRAVHRTRSARNAWPTRQRSRRRSRCRSDRQQRQRSYQRSSSSTSQTPTSSSRRLDACFGLAGSCSCPHTVSGRITPTRLTTGGGPRRASLSSSVDTDSRSTECTATVASSPYRPCCSSTPWAESHQRAPERSPQSRV